MKASSENQHRSILDLWLPIGLFVCFWAAVIVATLYFSPSWGLMDDFGLLKMAQTFKSDPAHFQVVTDNFITSGMLRPFYYSWAAVFYGIFENNPVGFYIFVAMWNMLAMIFWGTVFYHLFGVRREDRLWTVFFYPLTFFVFTPYWNIFNYLSLQEKFVVFFAPLVMYFFQRIYKDFRRSDFIWLYLCLFGGLMSKATFVYVPFVLMVYAFLDLVIFRYRPKTSAIFLFINGLIFGVYAIFTLTFQIQGNYTAKYKSGLFSGTFLDKLIHLPVLMKFLICLGIVGGMAVLILSVIRKQQERSPAIIIYMALITYVILLLPWGYQSYLISAMGPLALGAVFPVYAWLVARSWGMKVFVNVLIVILVTLVFTGNIIPSISRMADMGRAIDFLRVQPGTEADVYFMPPGYVETAETTQKFTQKKVHYCGDGNITEALLSAQGRNFVILTDLFPSIHLSGVWAGERVYANGTWEIFEITEQKGHQEKFTVPFRKTWLQELKVKIREM